MLKKLLAPMLGMAVMAPGLAFAGLSYDYDVYIDSTNRLAGGGIAGAHNSADTKQQIDCWTQYQRGIGDVTGGCHAVDAKGKQAYCFFFDDPKMGSLVQSINGDSSVHFRWDASGACTLIQVNENSGLKPKR